MVPLPRIRLSQREPPFTTSAAVSLRAERKVLERQLAVRAKTASDCPNKDSEPSDHDRPDSGAVRRMQIHRAGQKGHVGPSRQDRRFVHENSERVDQTLQRPLTRCGSASLEETQMTR